MVLRLQYLKYRVSGRQLYPYFLGHPRDLEVAERLIEHLERYVGTPRGDVDLETPEEWVPDVRIAKALIATALSRFYRFTAQQLEELLGEEELRRLHGLGIGSLEEFRLRFWRFVEEHYGGFIPSSQREQALALAAKEFNLADAEQVEKLLTAHREEYMLLQRQDSTPTAQDLIGAYNFEVLETLLYNCETVTFTIRGGSLGGSARTLIRLAKRFGVLVDLERRGGDLRATISGPRVFFGRASPFGWNIAQVLIRLLGDAPSLGISVVDLTIDVVLRDKAYLVRLPPDTLPPLNPRVERREVEAFLDSKVEKQFYWSWRNNRFRGWDIVREPEALIVGERLVVPDFALVKDDRSVLVEIIGYWREEYTRKKQAQLEALHRQGLKDLILLVDAKHRRHFSKSPYPVFFYRSRGHRYEIPYAKILKELAK